MKFQEALNKHKNIIFKGHENGEYLFSFDDDKEVYRFSDSEVHEVSDKYKSPEQRALDDKVKYATIVAYAELKKRANQYYIAFILMLSVAAISCFGGIYAYFVESKPLVCILLEASFIISLLLSWDNYRHYKKINK